MCAACIIVYVLFPPPPYLSVLFIWLRFSTIYRSRVLFRFSAIAANDCGLILLLYSLLSIVAPSTLDAEPIYGEFALFDAASYFKALFLLCSSWLASFSIYSATSFLSDILFSIAAFFCLEFAKIIDQALFWCSKRRKSSRFMQPTRP